MKKMRATAGLQDATSSALKGRKWKAVINGKKSINGARYGATYTGDVADAGEGQNLYDVLMGLAEYLEEQNAEMEFPDSCQVTLFPPNSRISDSQSLYPDRNPPV